MLAIFQTICSHIVTKKNRVITKSLMFPCTQIDDCRWQIGDSVYSVLFINKTHDTQNCGRWAESFPKQFFLFLHFLPSLRGSSFHCDATQVIELRALCFQIGVILSAKCSFTPSAIDTFESCVADNNKKEWEREKKRMRKESRWSEELPKNHTQLERETRKAKPARLFCVFGLIRMYLPE